MNTQTVKNIIEALLLSADEPLTLKQISAIFEENERPSDKEILQFLQQLSEDYDNRGIEVVQISHAYRIQTRKEYSHWLQRLSIEKPPRFSRALMETLAIIAYQQPVTRADIEEIRGVAVNSSIIKTLVEREWIKIAGHKDVIGKPAVFITTDEFLRYFNLNSLQALPEQKPIENDMLSKETSWSSK